MDLYVQIQTMLLMGNFVIQNFHTKVRLPTIQLALSLQVEFSAGDKLGYIVQ